jgi:hypothetical protein
MIADSHFHCVALVGVGEPKACNSEFFHPVYRLPKIPVTGMAIRDVLYRCNECGALYVVELPTVTGTEPAATRLARWKRLQ